MSDNKNSNPKKYIGNNEMTKNMKKKAHFFLIVSLLADVWYVFFWTIYFSHEFIPFMSVMFYFIPALVVKLSAILLGHFRHDDWQHSDKKFLAYRMEVILLIIIVDIISIIVLGVISYIFGVYNTIGFSGLTHITHDAAMVMLGMLESFAILSGPAIILGTIISLADTVKIKKFISKKIIPIKFISVRTIIILFSLAIAILLSILVISATIG